RHVLNESFHPASVLLAALRSTMHSRSCVRGRAPQRIAGSERSIAVSRWFCAVSRGATDRLRGYVSRCCATASREPQPHPLRDPVEGVVLLCGICLLVSASVVLHLEAVRDH